MLADGSSNVGLRAWDVHENYSLPANTVLGLIQIIAGLLSMALGVGAICTWSSGYYIGYGIWCGFIFTVTGGITIGAARHKNTCLIVTTMVLSIVSACCGIVQFSLGVVAADNDAEDTRHNIISGTFKSDDFLKWDIYYARNNPYTYLCAGQNTSLDWKYAWGPVDVLLLLTGFIEAVVAVAAAILCCQAVCCGLRKVSGTRGVYYGNTGTTGFSNEGYMTDPRTSPSPPLYKVM